MKAVAIAPANIAFVKYWGKADPRLNLPLNNSLSMNLSAATTTTKVHFSDEYQSDNLTLNGLTLAGKSLEKVSRQLDLLRSMAKSKLFASVTSHNNFPTGAGIASSASGFSALTVAAAHALNLDLNEKTLSRLARRGSGSACRSIPNGFVEWHKGDNDENSYAVSLFDEDYWEIHDLVVVVSQEKKRLLSSAGHESAQTSPFFAPRLLGLPPLLKEIKIAMKNKDFTHFGSLCEQEALNMHAVMMTAQPSAFYWLPETINILLKVQELRQKGIEAYTTIDAGPNVHILCEKTNVEPISTEISHLPGVIRIIDNSPAKGAQIMSETSES